MIYFTNDTQGGMQQHNIDVYVKDVLQFYRQIYDFEPYYNILDPILKYAPICRYTRDAILFTQEVSPGLFGVVIKEEHQEFHGVKVTLSFICGWVMHQQQGVII